MKIQNVAIAVTCINLVVMVVLLAKINPTSAQQNDHNELQVLRGRGLEIIDNKGKVRASITFHEPVEHNGTLYAGGILLRLINSKGQPSVKIDASEDGGALSFSNELQGYVQLSAKETGGFLKFKNANGKERIIKP